MATYILRPTAVYNNGGGTTPSAAATVLTNIGDNSDTTSVTNSANGYIYWTFTLPTPSVAGDEFVCRIGQSIRWSSTGTTDAYVGGVIYRQGVDPTPAGIPVVNAKNQATAVSTELGYILANGSSTWVTPKIKYRWTSQRTSTNTPVTYDVWGTIYTLKNATATPAATTWSTSTYPTVNVDLTATIDWEAGTFDWQNLRKVTADVRIESGGTGVGTGTLVATGTTDSLFTATGTNTVSVAIGTSIANGTYKIYARAIRHRENETSIGADQYGAWSTAATLTMSMTPPNAPTMTLTADQTLDRMAIAVTPVTSSGYTSPTFDVERSYDNATWTNVRGCTGVAGTFGSATTVYDYEALRGVTVYYRAHVSAISGTVLSTSGYSSTLSATINTIDWNVKCPENSALNMYSALVTGSPSEQLNEDLGIFQAIDRKYPVIVAGTLGGWDGELTIQTATSSDWSTLKALLESQKILLLESPFGTSKYIRSIGKPTVAISGTSSAPRRTVSISFIETDAP